MLVLASGSPRRAELLRTAGIAFLQHPAEGVDESWRPGEAPQVYVERLARTKAAAVAGGVVLGADTVVVIDGEILGKPADAADAERMLRTLSGRPHEVLTGICLRGSREVVETASTTVWFAPLSDRDIVTYLATGEPFDKAGAYGIQGEASKFVERIDGCYFNVVGLPVSLVWKRLRELRVI